MSDHLSRRSFLGSISALLASSVVQPVRAATAMVSDGGEQTLEGKLARFYKYRDSARFVGLGYLRGAGWEADFDRLTQEICGYNPARRQELNDASPWQRRKLLLDQIAQDFAESRTVLVDGWVLSETEARLCALAAIHEDEKM